MTKSASSRIWSIRSCTRSPLMIVPGSRDVPLSAPAVRTRSRPSPLLTPPSGGALQAEVAMEAGAAQVRVDADHVVTAEGEGIGEVGRDEALALGGHRARDEERTP